MTKKQLLCELETVRGTHIGAEAWRLVDLVEEIIKELPDTKEETE